MPFSKKYLLLFLVAALAGCASRGRIVDLAGMRHEIAILPMANETTNLDGPVILRNTLYQKLVNHGYGVLSLEETDSLLKELGVTDAGQLAAVPPEKITEKLQVRTLVYSNLLTFKPLRIAAIEVIKVKVRMWDIRSNTFFWETTQGVFSSERKASSESWASHLKYLAGSALVEKIFRIPLSVEIDEITNILVFKMGRAY